MKLRLLALALVSVLAALVVVTGGPAVFAESDPGLRYLHLEQRRIEQQRRRAAPRPAARRPARQAGPAVVVADTPEQPKIEPYVHIVVAGDSLAEFLAEGVKEAFEAQPEVTVTRKVRSSSGLVRADYYDWVAGAREIVALGDKANIVVMMAGLNDRQPIRDEGGVHDHGSERWRELYVMRLEEVIGVFREARVPLVWAGLPPMKSERLSADLHTFNDIVRGVAKRLDVPFIEIWEGFLDAQNRYSDFGPSFAGETVRLRTTDGIHFTKAGARKAAYFLEGELKRLVAARPAPALVALPSDAASSDPALQPGGIEAVIDRMVRPEIGVDGVPQIPVAPEKPAAGPIISLAEAPRAPGGQLSAGLVPVSSRDPSVSLAIDVLHRGRPPEPKPGRADDYTWSD